LTILKRLEQITSAVGTIPEIKFTAASCSGQISVGSATNFSLLSFKADAGFLFRLPRVIPTSFLTFCNRLTFGAADATLSWNLRNRQTAAQGKALSLGRIKYQVGHRATCVVVAIHWSVLLASLSISDSVRPLDHMMNRHTTRPDTSHKSAQDLFANFRVFLLQKSKYILLKICSLPLKMCLLYFEL
jgi:hypothetical protein